MLSRACLGKSNDCFEKNCMRKWRIHKRKGVASPHREAGGAPITDLIAKTCPYNGSNCPYNLPLKKPKHKKGVASPHREAGGARGAGRVELVRRCDVPLEGSEVHGPFRGIDINQKVLEEEVRLRAKAAGLLRHPFEMEKRPFFECFPYESPEPVLVKMTVSGK
eukprot:COSAG06_NODE_84_length_25090_cov_20.561042_20_plen_164_part_00